MKILDSGSRREFETGAVRDISEGKGRCDLLPLGILGRYLADNVLCQIENYIRRGNPNFLWAALNLFVGGNTCERSSWYCAMLEVAKQYEEGAIKYKDRNWEIGIPVHCYIDSGVRHYLKHKRGDEDEPHDRAFIWNILGAIWTHENKPEMIDLPFIEKKEVACENN